MEAGYEILFITPQNRRHHGKLVTDLLVDTAHELGIDRMTQRMDSEGQGHTGHLHSAHFFELADQPVEILFIVEETTGDELIKQIEAQQIPVFCVRKHVEFGNLGADSKG